MDLNDLRTSWNQYKVLKGLEGIPKTEIEAIMNEPNTSFSTLRRISILKYTFIHSFLIFFCQSC